MPQTITNICVTMADDDGAESSYEFAKGKIIIKKAGRPDKILDDMASKMISEQMNYALLAACGMMEEMKT